MTEPASKQEVMNAIYPYFKQDKAMCMLIGDMGFAVLDKYFDNHPDRVFNTGIAEQAMISMSAGMSLTGLKPLVYSQIPFLTMRAFEQIRYDLCEHNLNVKLIGIGADNYFSVLGRSHCMDDDDIKILSILKSLLILSPTKATIAADVKRLFTHDGPVYIRCV